MKFNRLTLWKVFTAMAIAALSVNLVAAQVVTDGLVGFWSLDASTISGDTVNDIWGDNHGTMIGGTEEVNGKIGEALSFNGVDSLVEIEHSESLNLVEAITIDFWFLLTGESTENQFPRVVSKGQSTVDNGAYGVWIVDTRNPVDIGFRSPTLVPTDIRSQALPDFNDGAWHHIAVTYDGEAGKLYFDGINQIDIPVTGDLPQTEDSLHIGDGRDERHFNGAVDEVHIYNRALDADEVRTNFEAESNVLAAVNAEFKLSALWGQLKTQ